MDYRITETEIEVIKRFLTARNTIGVRKILNELEIIKPKLDEKKANEIIKSIQKEKGIKTKEKKP